jgi:predicted transcriptional regulator
MKADASNLVIIDKAGRIRFFSAGVIKAEEINKVKQLLIVLAAE